MTETQSRRITVTSSFNDISTVRFGNRVMVRGGQALLSPIQGGRARHDFSLAWLEAA
jgi:hypothetical protein